MGRLLAFSLLSVCVTAAVKAADDRPVGDDRFTLVGYGDVRYMQEDVADVSTFSARFVPIFLFRLSDRMHVEAELEIAAGEDGETEQELEYANLHYFLSDTTTITAGKFLLPFGRFSSQFHPSWINRMPFNPGIYGTHGAGAGAMVPLLPVLSDTGIAVQKTVSTGSGQKLLFDVFVTNGPWVEDAPDDDMGEPEESEMPELEFEPRSQDSNRDKAVGGRVAYAWLPQLEIGASWYQAAYDEDESLAFTARGVDLNWIGSHYLLRGEYIRTETDVLMESEAGGGMALEEDAIAREGWYLQATIKLGEWLPSLGALEAVIERSEVTPVEASTRWAYGLNYWLDARSVIKLAYEETEVTEGEDDSRLVAQLSFGF